MATPCGMTVKNEFSCTTKLLAIPQRVYKSTTSTATASTTAKQTYALFPAQKTPLTAFEAIMQNTPKRYPPADGEREYDTTGKTFI
jgi:hypothetical protein